MNEKAANLEQEAIEKRAREFMAREPFPQEKTMEEVYGPGESWMLSVGRFRLILIPAVWEWWYEDIVHESWADTGYSVGEAVFSIRDNDLSPPRKKRQKVQEQAAREPQVRFCTSCGIQLSPGKRFCTDCGAPVGPVPGKSPLYCPACGETLVPGNGVCSSCGTKVQ